MHVEIKERVSLKSADFIKDLSEYTMIDDWINAMSNNKSLYIPYNCYVRYNNTNHRIVYNGKFVKDLHMVIKGFDSLPVSALRIKADTTHIIVNFEQDALLIEILDSEEGAL